MFDSDYLFGNFLAWNGLFDHAMHEFQWVRSLSPEYLPEYASLVLAQLMGGDIRAAH